MRHLIKYRFIQTVREWSVMFWALAFPIILGTFFFVSFGSGVTGEEMDAIRVAVIEQEADQQEDGAFGEFLEQMDGDALKIEKMDEEQALKDLKGDEITGIYYTGGKPSLTVAKSDLNTSILKSLLDSYNKNAHMIMKIAQDHPERLMQAVEALDGWQTMTEEVSAGGRTMDPNVSYFFALIAYACLSGAFLGVQASLDGQANLSALGARRSVTPTHKLRLVLTDMSVLFFIQFVNIIILTVVVRFVFGIDLGGNIGQILLVDLLGSMIGVSMGIMIGCVGKLSESIKMGLTVLLTLLPGFLAGLMFGNMKNIIEQNCPIINRINPAAVLSDTFYCMGVFDDAERFTRNLMILGLMSVLFIGIAFFAVRRERYDSI
ncbi:ABC transporter permease [Extibacter muris]|uniref:ABC transporter permease n=1 Tax=Extibacter muris TaxID=1796622 RepID=UPI001D095672|nr:ABC transporter permease [Extibacter muris]MCB6202789.1 ABC transporter permease [Extibacter muris]MCQ4664785.1 ABC transporter permease [Extibacter muris]MCQ4694074.1 ABC transporter permease [Extibacter muris]